MMNKTLYLCGAGNPEGVRLALRIQRREGRWERILILDDDPAKQGTSILDVPIAGPFQLLEQADAETSEVTNLVARTTVKRRRAQEKIDSFGLPVATLIDADVDLTGVTLGKGITVYPNATLCANSTVGDHSVVFASAVVGHGSRVGRGCVVAPGAVLNARVRLADEVYVGTNASILPDLTLGAGVTVGLNSAVMEDVPAGASVVGVPGEILGVAQSTPAEARLPLMPAALGATGISGAQQEMEATLASIWCDALKVSAVDAEDNLFDLGGDSEMALKVCHKIRRVTDRELKLTDLFRYPTIRSMARNLCGETHRREFEAHGSDAVRSGQARAAMRRRFH